MTVVLTEPNTVLTVTEQPELSFPGGLAGFPDDHRFTLVPVGEGVDLFLLRSLDTEGLEFVVVPPAAFFTEYSPEVDDATADELGLRTADDALLLLIVTLGNEPGEASANLLAPLVVNRTTREAAQVILTGSEYKLREPLPVA
jgi:flagellar assembly factor FliW